MALGNMYKWGGMKLKWKIRRKKIFLTNFMFLQQYYSICIKSFKVQNALNVYGIKYDL